VASATDVPSAYENGQDYDLLVNGISVPFSTFDLSLEYVDSEESYEAGTRGYYRGEGSFSTDLLSDYAHDLFVEFGDSDAETISMFLQGSEDALWLTGVTIESYERSIGASKFTTHTINWSSPYIRFAD
jgi:hypothetical protein